MPALQQTEQTELVKQILKNRDFFSELATEIQIGIDSLDTDKESVSEFIELLAKPDAVALLSFLIGVADEDLLSTIKDLTPTVEIPTGNIGELELEELGPSIAELEALERGTDV